MGIGVAILVDGKADDALVPAAVEVTERVGEATVYRLRYAIDIDDSDLPMLLEDRLGPGSDLAVVASVAGANRVLARGPVTGQQIHLAHGGTGSWLEVIGSDRSVEMDREVRAQVWDDVTASDVVRTVAARYGLEVDAGETEPRHVEAKHSLVQRDTDLRFVRRLARRCGFLFWIDDVDGVETAHFRRPALDGEGAARLVINRAGATVDALDIGWDVERPTSAVGAQLDLGDKNDIEGAVATSPLTALGAEPLAAIAAGTRTVQIVAPVDDAGDLKGRGEGALIDAGWFIRASCSTTAHRLKELVHAHSLVEVQGAGTRHSGTYYVGGVRHVVDDVAHVMELDLYRNAWGVG